MIHVCLDQSKLPTENNGWSYKIAEALLHICGMTEVWDEPNYGKRVFRVEKMPEDVPQAGVHWNEVFVPTFTQPPFPPIFKLEEEEDDPFEYCDACRHGSGLCEEHQ